MSENSVLYDSLRAAGYDLVFKPVLKLPRGGMKGNVDAELVLQAMIDRDSYEKAVIVTSDGDFHCLVKYLQQIVKLECVLAPSRAGCSRLLKQAAGSRIAFVDNLRGRLERLKSTR